MCYPFKKAHWILLGKHDMKSRRPFLTGLLALALAAIWSPLAERHARAETSASDFLVTMSESAITELTDESRGEQEKEARFRTLVNEAFDIPRIGKFILGVNWRSASDQQRQDFLEAFEDSNMRRFLPFFAEYKGEKFEILSERQDTNNAKVFFVNSKINRPEGAPVEVEWRIYKKNDNYKILDAVVEGVSMALSLRQEYNSVIQRSGLDGLIAQLQQGGTAGQ